jgi:hypothetical protein
VSTLARPAPAPVALPAGYERLAEALRHQLAHPLWRETDRRGEPAWTREGAGYRREITRANPLTFALTYLGPYVTDAATGTISFAELHLDLCRILAEWATPGAHRHAVVGPRKGGKSVYRGIVGPAWALAHGHRTFVQAFGATNDAARGHLANVLDLLHGRDRYGCSPLLLADFPELRPVKGAGGAGRTVLEGGGVLAAHGHGANYLGQLVGAERPDVLVGDDLTSGISASEDEVAKVKNRLRAEVLPMNDEAAVLLVGTVFAVGDLMDDVVRAANRQPARGKDKGRWLAAERFICHYHPANWPVRWTPERLAAERAADEHTYALKFAPHLLGTAIDSTRRFTPELWRWVVGFPTAVRAISIDPAVTAGPKADHTAIVVAGMDAVGMDARGHGRTCLEHVEQLRTDDIEDIRRRIFALCSVPGQRIRPTVVLWGRQNGGALLAEQLHPLPEGVKLITYAESAPKHVRIEVFHRQVKRGAVVLAEERREVLGQFTAQAEAWTRSATRDDQLDAGAAVERYFRTGTADM